MQSNLTNFLPEMKTKILFFYLNLILGFEVNLNSCDTVCETFPKNFKPCFREKFSC